MEIFRLIGGFGNIFFQLAKFDRLRSENHVLRLYIGDVADLAVRRFVVDFASRNGYKIVPLQLNIVVKIVRKLGLLSMYSLDSKPAFKIHLVSGYFQSLTPSEKFISRLTDYLESKYSMNNDNMNFIAVHFRGGDYLSDSNKKIYITLDQDYYERAISRFNCRDVEKYYFSLNTVGFLEDWGFERKVFDDDLEELFWMSKSSIFIMANSTFSYWAAILAAQNTIVVAPESWVKNSNVEHPKLLSKWTVQGL